MRRYTSLYFDLDNTLLDFSAAERRAITKLLQMHSLPSDANTASLYSDINRLFWERFERGEIKKEEIFSGRFAVLLEKLGRDGDPEKMGQDYFHLLAQGHDLMPGAEDILIYLKSKGYKIYATTNGISATQYKRIAQSGIEGYFDAVFVSEDAKAQKPEKEYFDYVMAHTEEKDASKVLVIGDSLTSDILGGINSGLDTCWFNEKQLECSFSPTYTIGSLEELKGIL